MPTVTVYQEVTLSEEVEIKAEFDAYCADCGDGICRLVSERGKGEIKIEPCPVCMEAARQEGHEEGKAEGREEGFRVGKQEGFDEGYEAGRINTMKEMEV